MSKILIISPVYNKTVGGAAVYYRILSENFMKDGHDVTLVSDVGGKNFKGHYIGLFPSWAGSDRSFLRDAIYYFWQNVQYLKLFSIFNQGQFDIAIVHSSFYNHPGIFSKILSVIVMRHPKTLFVADVRDRMISDNRISNLKIFHKIIACSKNIVDFLYGKGINKNVFYIPVIQEKLDISSSCVASVVAKNGLNDLEYCISVGAVKEDKSVDKLLKAFLNVRKIVESQLDLVVVGLLKTENVEVKKLLSQPGVHYLGALPRNDVLALMKGASLCINLSPNEGMPRASLEAIALNKPVLLPPNIPEFNQYCKNFVVDDLSESNIIKQLQLSIKNPCTVAYPLEQHFPRTVIENYYHIMNLSQINIVSHV